MYTMERVQLVMDINVDEKLIQYINSQDTQQ